VTLLWVVLLSFIHGAQLAFFGENIRLATTVAMVAVGAICALALGAAWVWEGKQAAAAVVERPDEIDPFAGGYPIPPLPGQRLREPSLQGARALADAGGHPEAADPQATDPQATDPEAAQPEAAHPETGHPEADHRELTDQESTRG
jgi:hypothetical protein